MGWSRLVRTVTQCRALNTDQWSVFTKPSLVFVKIFAQIWPAFSLFPCCFSTALSGSFSVFGALWRKWMAMLVFDLHKEHQVSVSQHCCYSFSTIPAGENRKQREKRRDMCSSGGVDKGGSFGCVGSAPHKTHTPFLSLHMLFCWLGNCSTYANLQG